jgi:hypothetical protein
MLPQFKRPVSKFTAEDAGDLILPVGKQIRAWRKANRKMGWGIRDKEFDHIEEPPPMTEADRRQGYIDAVLCYGFGDDGAGHADPVLSGKVAWEYAQKRWWKKTWRCEYIDFDKADHIRLRPEAPPRPKGFYYAKFQLGEKLQRLTVSQARKNFRNETGLGPEGVQLLAITHKHFQDLMNERKIPLMALADYDVAPYGYNDFFDAAQMFCSEGILGLGIGNVDQNYPLFGIPTIRLGQKLETVDSSS